MLSRLPVARTLKFPNSEDLKHEFLSDVNNTVLTNFYVDNCLKSLPSSGAAVKHVDDSRKFMLRGGFCVTKSVNYDRNVLESIPIHDRAKDGKESLLREDALPTERELGVSWCVENDKFGFKITVNDQPCTWRGILSIDSSMYGPLGMVVHFILPAKLLLQDSCRR